MWSYADNVSFRAALGYDKYTRCGPLSEVDAEPAGR
jgi:hypothetical protein